MKTSYICFMMLAVILFNAHAHAHPCPGNGKSLLDISIATQNAGIKAETGYLEKRRRFSEVYDQAVICKLLQGMDDKQPKQLVNLFDALAIISAYTNNPTHVHSFRQAFETLSTRGLATPKHAANLFDALISVHDFDGARRLIACTPGIPRSLPVLDLSETRSPSIWDFSYDGKITRATKKFIDLSGVDIVVVAHPNCHFSRNAIDYIESSPALKKAFTKRTILVAPPLRDFDLRPFQRWNLEHKDFKIHPMFEFEEWHMVDEWATPIFYFMKNGRLEKKIVGWPKDNSQAVEIMSYLRLPLHD